MKSYFKFAAYLMTGFIVTACSNHSKTETATDGETQHSKEEIALYLTARQQKSIGIELGHIEKQRLGTSLKINGKLELPPQYRAKVSSFLGGNVKTIKVQEGDWVQKGDLLALLTHPDVISLQQKYQELTQSLVYLKEEYERKETLYQHDVSAQKSFQKTRTDYEQTKAKVRGIRKKLALLKLDPKAVAQGEIFTDLAIRAPIDGYINTIKVSMGEYIPAEKNLFVLTDNTKLQGDFLIYEKDLRKVKKGQYIQFSTGLEPQKLRKAKVVSVGKHFDPEYRAVHLRAKLIDSDSSLIPGLYVNGQLLVGGAEVKALPHDAIVSEGQKNYIFITPDSIAENTQKRSFKMVEIITGSSNQQYTEIKLLKELPPHTSVVTKGAYYLQADRTKAENEHSH